MSVSGLLELCGRLWRITNCCCGIFVSASELAFFADVYNKDNNHAHNDEKEKNCQDNVACGGSPIGCYGKEKRVFICFCVVNNNRHFDPTSSDIVG